MYYFIIFCNILIFIHAEIFKFDNYLMNLNSFLPIRQFYFDKGNTEFSYNINIKKKQDNNNSILYIYLFDNENLIKNKLNIFSNPNICCDSYNGPSICSSNELLTSFSSYNKSYEIINDKVNDTVLNTFTDKKMTGIIFFCEILEKKDSTLIQYTSKKDNDIELNGFIKFSNNSFFLSKEENIIIFVYLFSSIVHLIFILKLCYSYYKKFHKNNEKSQFYIKIFIAIVPLIFISQITKIKIQIDRRKKGEIYILLIILESIISIMIDFILKIIYLLIGLGYTINLNQRLYNQENNENKDLKYYQIYKFKFFYILCPIYYICYILKNYYYYKTFYFNKDMSLMIFFNVILNYIDIYIWCSIYLKINNKLNKMKSINYIKDYFQKIKKFIILYGIISLIGFLFFVILKFIKMSIIINLIFHLIFEIRTIILLIGLILSLFGNLTQTKEGFILQPSLILEDLQPKRNREFSLDNLKTE